MPESSNPHVVALIGAGRVGTAAAVLLQRSGHEIAGIASRSADSARRAESWLAAPVTTVDDLMARPVTLVLLGVGDSTVAGLVAQVAPALSPDAAVVHFAGSFGVGSLSGLREDVHFLALHPVQACPSVEAGVARLPGSTWGVTTTEGAESLAAALVRDMGGRPVAVAEVSRPLWHAAAAVSSNGMAAMLAVGEALLHEAGIDDPREVLGPLAQGTVANVVERGAGEALTGPVVRADVSTIRRHVDAIARVAPELLDPYREALEAIVQAALVTHRIDDDTARAVDRVVRVP